MVYLYAVMGVVMMTGIMAMFEMGLSLTGQSLLPTPADVYFNSNEQGPKLADNDVLRLLANSGNLERGLSGQELCKAINNAGSGQYFFDTIVDSSSKFDCQQTTFYNDAKIFHRMLIKPPAQGVASLLPYELFSCTSARDGYQCSFERNEGG